MKKIKAIFLDCDGVLTTGSYFYTDEGKFLKEFSSMDGKGFDKAKKEEIYLMVVTEEPHEMGFNITKKRCEDQKVDLEDLNILRNLSEIEATRTILETFKKEINNLTVQDKGDAEIRNYIKLSKCRPFVVKNQGYIVPKKSVFNKIIGDSHLELRFASFLENCEDMISNLYIAGIYRPC